MAWLDHQRLHLASVSSNARHLLLGRLSCPVGGLGEQRRPFNAKDYENEVARAVGRGSTHGIRGVDGGSKMMASAKSEYQMVANIVLDL